MFKLHASLVCWFSCDFTWYSHAYYAKQVFSLLSTYAAIIQTDGFLCQSVPQTSNRWEQPAQCHPLLNRISLSALVLPLAVQLLSTWRIIIVSLHLQYQRKNRIHPFLTLAAPSVGGSIASLTACIIISLLLSCIRSMSVLVLLASPGRYWQHKLL